MCAHAWHAKRATEASSSGKQKLKGPQQKLAARHACAIKSNEMQKIKKKSWIFCKLENRRQEIIILCGMTGR